MAERFTDRVWWGNDLAASAARLFLTPFGMLYLAAADLRNRGFDNGRFRTMKAPLPVVSVGNLTAGGTGKTPISAWIASELRRRGAKPAIVMRGYGDDERLVHSILAPDTPVVVAASRVDGATRARTEFGCDVAILDDGFQHRWVHRDVDIVLLGAEETLRGRLGLPAGPWRERLESVRRASIAVVTRKTASADEATAVVDILRHTAPALPTAVIFLAPKGLVTLDRTSGSPVPTEISLTALQGTSVLAIAAIANARAFVGQLRGYASRVTEAIYADHHQFSASEVVDLAGRAGGVDRVVCTLKDFVKLAPVWPGKAPPLWYVSQQVIIERGADAIDRQLADLLPTRPIN